MQTQDLVLDIVPGGVPPVIDVTQYDTARAIKITLSSRTSASFSLSSSYTYELRGTRANKTGFIDTDAVSMIDSRTLIFTTTGTMTSIAGECRCGILIFDGEEHIETINFIMQVHRASLEAETIVNDQNFESIVKDAVEEVIDEQGLVVDDQLETPGAAADAKATGDEIRELKSAIEDVSGLSDEAKEALLACFANVAWIGDDGQDYYDALEEALYNTTWAITNNLTNCTTSNAAQSVTKGGSYSATITASAGYVMTGATVSVTMGGTDITSTVYSNGTITIAAVTGALVITISAAAKTVSSISAVYTQSGTVYDTDDLDDLKADLVVTATYTDSSTETIPAASYTLSGTLTAGTSTITVSYSGKTSTFNVTVTALTLDDVAYGTQTYRDIFITNNKLSPLGDFETPVTLSTSEVNIGNNLACKINAGTPAYSTEAYDSPTHSLKCFGSTSTQLRCRDSSTSYPSGSVFLGCVSVKVDRAVAGAGGLQITFPYSSYGDTLNLGTEEVTDGFEQYVGILTLTAKRTGCQLYPGTRNSANMDCYVDDVVLTPAPSGITEAEALDVYNKYLFIKRRDAA